MAEQSGKIEGLRRVNEFLQRFPEHGQIAANRAFKEHGHAFTRDFVKRQLSGGRGLKRRTGAAARAFNTVVMKRNNNMILRVFASGEARKYLPVHEFGATITPKNVKWLTIPQAPVLTRAGVHRYQSARDVKGLRFIPYRSGGKMRPFLGKMENGRMVVYYALRKKVKIPARLKFGQTWIATAPGIVPRLDREINKELSSMTRRT